MTGSPHYDKYSMTGSRFVYIFFVLGGLASAAAYKGGAGVGTTCLAILIVSLIWAVRKSTITSQDGITVRGMFGAKTISWADIQDIRVEANPVGRYETQYTKGAPKQLVTVYDRHGKRAVLPNINQETLRKGKSLAEEVEHIRSTWEQLRGDDWAHASRPQDR